MNLLKELKGISKSQNVEKVNAQFEYMREQIAQMSEMAFMQVTNGLEERLREQATHSRELVIIEGFPMNTEALETTLSGFMGGNINLYHQAKQVGFPMHEIMNETLSLFVRIFKHLEDMGLKPKVRTTTSDMTPDMGISIYVKW